MKKNAMLKIAAILLVAVLLTTCAISATFAKYVTKVDVTDTETARVAKWGITVTANADTAFASSYTWDDKLVVNATEDVLAPGTKKVNALTITVAGDPEVAVNILPEIEVIASDWMVGEEVYFPVEFIINEDEDNTIKFNEDDNYTGSTQEFATWLAGIATTINDELKADVILPSNDSTTEFSKTVTIGWIWNFGATDEINTLDTALGNAAATGTAPTIKFAGSVTVSQVGGDSAI